MTQGKYKVSMQHRIQKISAVGACAMLGLIAGQAGVMAGATQATSAFDTDPSLFDFEHVSCTGAPNQIRIVVTNVEQPVGLMTTDLYNNDADNFLKTAGRARQVRVAAKAPYTKFCLTAPAPGEYSIAVYHDENANLKFDKGTFGLPVEPWGLSGDPKIRFGPPHISKTLFEVTETGASVQLRLRDK